MNHIYLLILSSFITIGATAQTISLEQCRNAALKNNKEGLAARTKVEKTEYDVKVYKSNFYPKFTVMASDIYSTASGSTTISGGNLPVLGFNAAAGTYVPSTTTLPDGSTIYNEVAYFPDQKLKFKISNFFMGGITFSQPLYMGGKITAAYSMSRIANNIANINTRLTDSEIIVETDEAYAMAVKAKELCKVAEKYKEMLAELYKNVESAYRHGMVTKNDLLKVQVKQNEVELQLKKAQNGLRLAKMNLCHVTGLDINTDIDILAESISLNENNIVFADTANIYSRPEYEMLNEKVELAKQNVKLTKSEFLPNVALAGGYTYNNGMEVNNKNMINTGAATVMVTASFPIFHFGEGSNKIKSAKAEQRIAELEQTDLNEKMQLELAQARNNLDEAFTELELTRKSLEQSDENVKMSKSQYNYGMEPLSDLLEAQSMWQQAYANEVDARCNLFIMNTRYLKALGKLR